MSSLRNSVQRRNHRERAQPAERAKWGLLEKKKDYKLRAADHKTKQRKLRALQEKARDRNEDEFYFGMMSSSSRDGVKVAKRDLENGGSPNLAPDVLRLMKTQDVAYLRTVLQQTRRERERLEQEAVVGEFGVALKPAQEGKRVVFGEDGVMLPSQPEQRREMADIEEDDDDDSGSEDEADADLDDASLDRKRTQQRRRRKVQSLLEREQQLGTALRNLEDQRAKSNGTMGGVANSGAKFKVRRKR